MVNLFMYKVQLDLFTYNKKIVNSDYILLISMFWVIYS